MAVATVGADSPSFKVELSISCSSLPNLDLLSKSDPICVLYTKASTAKSGRDSWVKYGMTEMIKDNLNPKVRDSVRHLKMLSTVVHNL